MTYNTRPNGIFHRDGPTSLPEYQERALYTTWNLSFTQIENQDSDAAKLLTLLAYFGNQDVWHDIVYAGAHADATRPTWFIDLTSDAFCLRARDPHAGGVGLGGSTLKREFLQYLCLHARLDLKLPQS
jgi:hypothetical protein